MNILFNSIARAGGIEVPSQTQQASVGSGSHVSDSQASVYAYRSILAIENLVRRVVSGLRTRRQRRAALAELRALNDRTLKDIGLPRSEIGATVEALLNGTLDRGTERRHGPEAAPVIQLPARTRPADFTPCDQAA
jgi:uncharacterized protein YjiS (DUF1127 family)